MPFRDLEYSHDICMIRGVPMRNLTTFRIGGPAGIILTPRTLAGLEKCLTILERNGIRHHILGRGSNLLVSDRGVDVVLSLAGFAGIERHYPKGDDSEGEKYVYVTVGAGCGLKQLIAWSAANMLGGLEDLAGIPGSVGGAFFMNAGAAGGTFGDIVHRVLISSGRGSSWLGRECLRFGYRKTSLPKSCVVSAVRLKLRPARGYRQRQYIAKLMRRRISSQPLSKASAGCIFRNFNDVSAGFLIDRCGMKGRMVGGAMISPMHANFIVNTGDAECSHVMILMDKVRERVCIETGRALKTEVKLWQ